MTRIPYKPQMKTDAEPGQARCARRSTLAALCRQQDRSAFPRRAGFFSANAYLAPGFVLPLVAEKTSRGFGPGIFSICIRLSAFAAARPRFFRPLDHLGCNRSDPAKSHVSVPSSAARYVPNISERARQWDCLDQTKWCAA